MQTINKYKKLFSLITMLFILIFPVLASDGFDDPANDVPVDGGLSLLIAAGVGYGAKKIRQYKK
jgi:hypothetical protein